MGESTQPERPAALSSSANGLQRAAQSRLLWEAHFDDSLFLSPVEVRGVLLAIGLRTHNSAMFCRRNTLDYVVGL